MASFEKLKNGRYAVRYWEMKNGVNKQFRLPGTFAKKKEAQTAYSNYERTNSLAAHSVSITFLLLYHEYKKHIKTRLKDSTIVDKRCVIEKHIMPTFENRKMSSITKLELLRWQQSIDHYAYKYKKKIRTYFSAVWNFGVMYLDVCPNLFTKIEPFAKPKDKVKMSFWTKEEFTQFINVVDDDLWKAFFSFLYLTGCRIGEAFALKWEDVSQDSIDINKSITRKVLPEERKQLIRFKETPPKNLPSYRVIPIPNALYELLNAVNTGSLYLFGKDVKPLTEQAVYRAKGRYCELAGVKNIKAHDFRHSHASLLINSGININVVSARLGHKNLTETLNTYNHFFETNATSALTVLDFKI